LFLRHEGYLGAIGAFLKVVEEEGQWFCLIDFTVSVLPCIHLPVTSDIQELTFSVLPKKSCPSEIVLNRHHRFH